MTKLTKMTIEQARKITGNQPRWALANMIKALAMCSGINTPEENERLAVAKWLQRQKR
jgi:hypothetical protein